MGGSIAMIVRKQDAAGVDQYVPMLRWTNAMPWHFSDVDLLTGRTDTWWASFTETWDDMRRDYERNRRSGKFELPMTDAYFPWDVRAPSGYGLVVVDLPRQIILHSQGYCSLGALRSTHVRDDDTELQEHYGKLRAAGILRGFEMLSYDKDGEQVLATFDLGALPWPVITAATDRAMELRRKHRGLSPRVVAECFGLPPHAVHCDALEQASHAVELRFPFACDWTFCRFDEGPAGLLPLRQQLNEWGYPFTEADNQAWIEHLANYELSDPEQQLATTVIPGLPPVATEERRGRQHSPV